MKENDLNRILNKSFKKKGFSHKISDGIQGISVQNPFDGFSVFLRKPWYWESKFSKKYEAFNFNRIEDHQMSNLLQIKNELVNSCYSLIILGIYEPRKFFDIFLFDINFIVACIIIGKKSILKKELLDFKEKNMFIPLKRDKELKDYCIDESIDIEQKVILN